MHSMSDIRGMGKHTTHCVEEIEMNFTRCFEAVCMHTMQQVQGAPIKTPYPLPDEEGVVLESYCDDHHGYLLLEVDGQILKGQYFAVPTIQEPASTPAQQIDAFTLDLKTHQLQD
jgi:hypothetical protein